MAALSDRLPMPAVSTLNRPSGGRSGTPPHDAATADPSALRRSARPLIALATQLRSVTVESPGLMKQALAAAVARFEREATAAGCDERSVAAASYVLCVWVDEVVADTPWGEGGAGLLARFHGEGDGSVKVMRLLSRLAEEPRQHRALLELFHACLSLGLQGRLRGAPDAPRELDALRRRVFMTLPTPEPALSPAWESAVPLRSGIWRRAIVAALVVLGLLALGVYTASRLLLADRVDQVFASMQQLAPGGVVPTALAASAPAVGQATTPASPPKAAMAPARLAPLLAQEVAAGRLSVHDEPHRSVVGIPAATLFGADSTRLRPDQAELLARVAAALARHNGKVLVIGHTDGRDPRTARLPSAWHQSQEWASQVAAQLRPVLGDQRVSAEGAGDQIAADDRGAPPRRIDIVLYP
jgi:type VI secretion system protein ImpK